MTWCRIGDEPLPEPLMSQYTDVYIDGLVQDCSISSALALEILQFCTKPSICLNVLKQMDPT